LTLKSESDKLNERVVKNVAKQLSLWKLYMTNY